MDRFPSPSQSAIQLCARANNLTLSHFFPLECDGNSFCFRNSNEIEYKLANNGYVIHNGDHVNMMNSSYLLCLTRAAY